MCLSCYKGERHLPTSPNKTDTNRELAMQLMDQGMINDEVIAGLVAHGMSKQAAEQLVQEIRFGNQKKEKREAYLYVFLGIFSLVYGVYAFYLQDDNAVLILGFGGAMVGRGYYLLH